MRRVNLPADQHPTRIDPEGARQAVAVLADSGVTGEPPKVQGVERRVADAADASAEAGDRAGKLRLEPADAAVLAPAQSASPQPPGLGVSAVEAPDSAALSFAMNPLSPSSSSISIRFSTYGWAAVAGPGTSLMAPR